MITVSNSSVLHSVVVGEEGSMVCSLWGTVTRSYKGGLVTGNLECNFYSPRKAQESAKVEFSICVL